MNRLIWLMLVLFPFGVRGQVVRLSLDEATGRFLKCNLSLMAARYDIDKAQAQVIQAGLFENPVVSFEQNVYNPNSGKYFDMGPEGESAVEVEQLIYLAGQRNKRVRLEKINREIAVYQFKEVLRTLHGELAEKFIELYYTHKALAVYDRETDCLTTLLQAYRDQCAKGNVSLLEKSRLEALRLLLRQERNVLSDREIALQGDLRLLLAVPAGQVVEPIFDESVLDRIDLSRLSLAELGSRLAGRPDLQLVEAGIQASKADVKLQKSLAFPEVTLKGAYDRKGNFCNNYWALGVSVSIPLFNRNQGNIKMARLSVLQQQSLAEQAHSKAENELVAVYSKLEKALDLYHSTEDSLERDFDRIIRGVNDGFRKRDISLLEFVDYYQTYKETCLQLYDIRKNLAQAAEELNRVVDNGNR